MDSVGRFINMIYSEFDSNWFRLNLIIENAKYYYKETENTKFRVRIKIENGKILNFSIYHVECIEKEENLVAMFYAWLMISIESLINLIIADKFEKKLAEKIIKGIGKKNNENDLVFKIKIIFENNITEEIINKINNMYKIRNTIIHDKPVSIISGTDDYEIIEYCKKDVVSISYMYDKIIENIKEISDIIIKLIKTDEKIVLAHEAEYYDIIKMIT